MIAWILGVVAAALALGIMADPLAVRLGDRPPALRAMGRVAHRSLAVVVVGSGIYDLGYVTPFALAWRPDELDRLDTVPYGALSHAILVAKLARFAVLVVLASILLRRTLPGAGIAGARATRLPARRAARRRGCLGAPVRARTRPRRDAVQARGIGRPEPRIQAHVTSNRDWVALQLTPPTGRGRRPPAPSHPRETAPARDASKEA